MGLLNEASQLALSRAPQQSYSMELLNRLHYVLALLTTGDINCSHQRFADPCVYVKVNTGSVGHVLVLSFVLQPPTTSSSVAGEQRYHCRHQLHSSMHLLPFNAGIPTFGYSGHSLQKGAAVTADCNGISRHHIKLLGRWKSDAVDVYINERKQSEQMHRLLFLNDQLLSPIIH